MDALRTYLNTLEDASFIELDVGWLANDFGSPEAEYASIRKRVGLFPAGHLGRIVVTGDDTRDFLQRICAQQLKGLQPGQATQAAFLDGDGHIWADTHIGCVSEDNWWIDSWKSDIDTLIGKLEHHHFGEDCKWSKSEQSALIIAGVAAFQTMSHFAGLNDNAQPIEPLVHISPTNGSVLRLNGFEQPHYLLWQDTSTLTDTLRTYKEAQPDIRIVGWEGYNTLRTEDNNPWYHIDFGVTNVPAEVGEAYISSAVSTTKGCYPGQEAVLRMYNLGHPKKLLVKLKVDSDHPPLSGAPVMLTDAEKCKTAPRGGVIGAVTSSCLSPLLGATPIALAMVKWGKHKPGAQVRVAIASDSQAGGTFATAEVISTL